MAKEEAEFISDLVSTNPVASDPISQGDDHIRTIKKVLQNTFPEASGALYVPGRPTSSERILTSVDNNGSLSWEQNGVITISETGNITANEISANSIGVDSCLLYTSDAADE